MQNGASEVKVGTIKAGDLTPRRARPPVCRHAVAELRKLQQKKKLQGRLGWGPATWRDFSGSVRVSVVDGTVTSVQQFDRVQDLDLLVPRASEH